MPSAALCGDSRAERPSAKSPCTPSVTNTRVFPFATGSTATCSAGNCEPTTPPRSSSTLLHAALLGPRAHQRSLHVADPRPGHHAMLLVNGCQAQDHPARRAEPLVAAL